MSVAPRQPGTHSGERPVPRVVERWPASGSSSDLGWLVEGENGLLLEWLRESHAGKVDLVYVDPPFATGAEFMADVGVGPRQDRLSVERPAYSDHWASLDGYLSLLRDRLVIARDLLSERGSLYVHLDQRACAPVRLLLDALFGPECFVNEIIWAYRTGGVPAKLGFSRKHDNILFYVKNRARAIWNPQREKSYLSHRYGFSNVTIHEDERGPYTLVACRDVFEIPALRGNQPERVSYPTQKPEALLERIVRASSEPGSLVLDFFSGSGTSLVVAARLGRRFIGCDRGAHAVRIARRRLTALATHPELVVMRFDAAEHAPDLVPDGVACAYSDGTRPAGASSARHAELALAAHGAEPWLGADGTESGLSRGAGGDASFHGILAVPGGFAAVHVSPPETALGTERAHDLALSARARGFVEVHVLVWNCPDWSPPLDGAVPVVGFQVSRELLFDPPPRHAPLVLERPRFDVALDRDGARGRVVLRALRYAHPERLPPIRSSRRVPSPTDALAPHWSDLIEELSVDVSGGCGLDPLVVAWSALRDREGRIPLESPWLELPASGSARVQLVTVHGVTVRVLASVRE